MKDMFGKEFTDGCRFVKATVLGRSPFLEVRTAAIKDGKLYGTDRFSQPIRYPERCLIIQ